MLATVDHAFICCSKGAPEADALVALGLIEGSGNRHPGQGTSNRRFFFNNAYVELLWVSNEDEARSSESKGTRLWERCSSRSEGVCPFGILFRTVESALPFATWSYKPRYLPTGASIRFAQGVPMTEPELAFLNVENLGIRPKEPVDHRVPIREILKMVVRLPSMTTLSKAAKVVHDRGLITFKEGSEHMLELIFASEGSVEFDLRPTLPLVFRGGSKGVV